MGIEDATSFQKERKRGGGLRPISYYSVDLVIVETFDSKIHSTDDP